MCHVGPFFFALSARINQNTDIYPRCNQDIIAIWLSLLWMEEELHIFWAFPPIINRDEVLILGWFSC